MTAPEPRRHLWACCDDDGVLDECVCGLADRYFGFTEPGPDDYGDPLIDVEPVGGDPYWRQDDQW